jgi:hypothetical protein
MKAFNYSIMILGMLLFLEFAGIKVGTNILSLVGIGTDSFGLSLSNFYTFLLGSGGILILGLGGGIIVGVITRSSPENFIILPFITGVLAIFIQGIAGIINYSLANYSGWISGIMILVLGVLGFGYIFSLVEFFRGTD